MDFGLIEADETVEAVLQGVITEAQQWAAIETDTREATSEHQQQSPQFSPGLQHFGSADQAPLEVLAGSASPQLTLANSVPDATAPDALSHMPPVLSAINPLFLPAQPRRPQSAQLQQTLSAMCDQLSALEDSIQHLPEEVAAGTPAGTHSPQSVRVGATADLLQQRGSLSHMRLF